MEEQGEVAVRFTDAGEALFFEAADGAAVDRVPLTVPPGVSVTSITAGTVASGWFAYGLSTGEVLILKHAYKVTYPNDLRLITPRI